LYEQLLKDMPENMSVAIDETIQVLVNAKAALVTSGTATLETAILHVPQVVCYKTTRISYLLARQLSKVNYICLVNLILNRELIKELIQNKCTPVNISKELGRLLNDSDYVDVIESGYDELSNILNDVGASTRVAQAVVNFVAGV